MFSVLLQDRLGELDSLMLVECPLIQEHAKVLQRKGHLTRLGWQSLELLDCLSSSEEAPRRICSDFGSFKVVARVEQLVKLLCIEIVGTGQASSGGQLHGNLGICWVLQKIGNSRGLINSDKE